MARLLVIVEGQTEEDFVKELLASHLHALGFHGVSARLMGNARQRSRRGGIKPWASARDDILRHLRSDVGCIVTTMVDYYRLPATGGPDREWPGRSSAAALAAAGRASHVESGIGAAINVAMGQGFDPNRFVPFVVLHEFEGLLFSDCNRFASGIGHANLASSLASIRSQFASPEEINDAPATHPSQRVLDLLPSYQKPLLGVLAALEIGLEQIRAECPHFSRWICNLEALA